MSEVCESCETFFGGQHFTAGVTFERDRITKLLESDPEDIIASGGGLRAGYETAIALIKGE